MNFEEWNKETDSLCPRRAFDVAFNYQQAKISILQIKLNGADERAAAVLNHKNYMVDKMQAKIDELQARIDEALYAADESCGVSVAAFVKLNRILKGNKDEN